MVEMKDYIEEKNIIAQWDFQDKIYVSISCLTFNHEMYISQAIDSFLKQKTKYKFEIVIHDDKSNDNTVSILKKYKEKYPNIIKLVLQDENIYSKGKSVIKEVLSYTSGIYIAFCEGDDWWFDEHKIEKQVEQLQSSKYILTHSNCYVYYHDEDRTDNKYESFINCSVDNLIQQKYIIRFASVMVKAEVLNDVVNYIVNNFPKNMKLFDLPMWCLLREKGHFYFDTDFLSVYRIINESASHSKNKNKMLEFSRSVTEVMIVLSKLSCISIKSKLFIIKRTMGLFKFAVKQKSSKYVFISFKYFFKSICNLSRKDKFK